MAKSRRKKAKRSAELENRVQEASFTLAALLLGQLIESLVKRSLDRTTAGDDTAPALQEGISTVKSVADDLIPRWSEIFASVKDKIQRAVERVADAPGEFNRAALLGLVDGIGETFDALSPEREPKKSKKRKKSKIISGDLDAGTKSD